MKRWFHRTVLARPALTFVVMGLCFFAFGASSVNLFLLLSANIQLILQHGWQALVDGGLWQLAELLVSGYFSVAAYLVFKACESHLVGTLLRPPLPSHPSPPPSHENRSSPW